MNTNEQEIEQEIQDKELTAPRLTPEGYLLKQALYTQTER